MPSAETGPGADWGTSGWTRRRFINGMGLVGAAALGSQLVTSRVAIGEAATPTQNTLVVVFLRGGADGLGVLVPGTPSLGLDHLKKVRPRLVPDRIGLPGQRGWALNSALKPLYDTLWKTGELAFVPAVATRGISMSHFQAQQYLEKGGSDRATDGWLDRLLPQLGSGTTFRAISIGSATPLSMVGRTPVLAMAELESFTFPGWDQIVPASQRALRSLYRGTRGPLATDVPTAITAANRAKRFAQKAAPRNGAKYPDGEFGSALADLATLLRAEVGVRVATVDVGGWDTHTDEATDLNNHLRDAAAALKAFTTDLGPRRRSRVTVVVMSEFGRRVEMNASGGTDHGHGSVMWLLGGGLKHSGVYGRWHDLTSGRLDAGNIPGWNNPFDLLGEVARRRLGVGSLSKAFPGHHYKPLGLMR